MTPEQEALVVRSMPSVQRLARFMVRRLPPSVDVYDLISAGYLALVTAALRYNRARASFGGYALVRARGAMLDYLRKQYPVQGFGHKAVDIKAVPIERALNYPAGLTEPFDDAQILYWIRHVSDRRARVILRGELRGFTQEEMGRRLGISPSMCSWLRRRALREIRRQMKLSS